MDYLERIATEIPEINHTITHKEPELHIITPTKEVSLFSGLIHSNFPFLKLLSIQHQLFSREMTQRLSQSFARNTSLETLILSFNTFESTDLVRDLSKGLILSKSLRNLDLSSNEISEDLSSLLSSSASFTSVSLNNNEISVGDFGSALAANTTLKEFSINYNPLTQKTAIEIIDTLATTHTLASLEITGVESTDLIFPLARALKHSSISSLCIDLDNVPEEALEALENTLLNENQSLVSLNAPNIDWSFIEEGSALDKINKAVSANHWIKENPNSHQTEKDPKLVDIINHKLRTKQSVHEPTGMENTVKELTMKIGELERHILKQDEEYKSLEERLTVLEHKNEGDHSVKEIMKDIDELKGKQSTTGNLEGKLDAALELFPHFDKKLDALSHDIDRIFSSVNLVKKTVQNIELNQQIPSLLKNTPQNRKSESVDTLNLEKFIRHKKSNTIKSNKKKYFPGEAESRVVNYICESYKTKNELKLTKNYNKYFNLSPAETKRIKIESFDMTPTKDNYD